MASRIAAFADGTQGKGQKPLCRRSLFLRVSLPLSNSLVGTATLDHLRRVNYSRSRMQPSLESNQPARSAALATKRPLLLFWLPLIAVFVALLMVEGGVRLMLHFASRSAEWSDRPHTYFFPEASHSSRDYAHTVQKPQQTFRIGVIGDSFTFGDLLQFDDTFSKRLERDLTLNESAPSVQVLNFGVSGYSTANEVSTLRLALRYSPNLILLQVTLNDPELVPFHPRHRELDSSGLVEFRWPILNLSKALKLIATRLENTELRRQYHDYFFSLFADPLTLHNFQHGLSEIKALSDRAGVPVLAVLFPLLSELIDERYPFAALHQIVAKEAAERNIPLLDLTRAFYGIPHERLEVAPGSNAHPNEIANRIAAEEIYRWLVERKALPESAAARCSAPERIGLRRPRINSPKPAYCKPAPEHS